jgi:hypothetical protein
VVFDNEPSDQDGDAGDTENCGPAFVSILLRFCRCPVASKTSSTEYEDEGHFDPKLRGRHGLNKNVDATHLATPLNAASTAVWRISNTPARQGPFTGLFRTSGHG